MNATCTHIAIHARDVERAVAFYKRYAGLVEAHRRVDGDVTVVWLGERGREKEFVIVLLGFPHESASHPAPLAHIGYAVDSRAEVERLARAAAERGELVDGPTEGGPIVGYYCIIEDPDGNYLEFSYGQALGSAQE